MFVILPCPLFSTHLAIQIESPHEDILWLLCGWCHDSKDVSLCSQHPNWWVPGIFLFSGADRFLVCTSILVAPENCFCLRNIPFLSWHIFLKTVYATKHKKKLCSQHFTAVVTYTEKWPFASACSHSNSSEHLFFEKKFEYFFSTGILQYLSGITTGIKLLQAANSVLYQGRKNMTSNNAICQKQNAHYPVQYKS